MNEQDNKYEMSKMSGMHDAHKTLLHICCAPCSYMCIETLRAENIDVTGFWYNPNIHPYTEYKARRDTLIMHAKNVDMPLVCIDTYGLREFVRLVYPELDDRCEKCYDVRLEKAAAYAAENGFDSFTTSLLISPYQKHDLIAEVAQRKAEKYGVEFLYRDFRPYFREGQKKAREAEYYMQRYCGCIFSEEERYLKKK